MTKTSSTLIHLFLLLAVLSAACSFSAAPAAQPASPSSLPAATVLATVPAAFPALPSGTTKQSLTVDGTLRHYLVHIPSGYDGQTALPLVLILHGLGGSPAGMEKSTGMSEKADQEKFFVAYLLGTGDPPSWNSGLAPDLQYSVDDVEFVRQMLLKLEGDLNVDASRVYAAGFSNGGFMTHRLAAELPDVLAAAAVVEGTLGIYGDDGTLHTIDHANGPIPMLIIHGKQDPNIPYDGGKGSAGAQPNVVPVSYVVDFWTKADSCSGDPQTQTSADQNILTTDYRNCADGSEVLLDTIVNGVHAWPTLQGKPHFSGTDAVWEFFSRH